MYLHSLQESCSACNRLANGRVQEAPITRSGWAPCWGRVSSPLCVGGHSGGLACSCGSVVVCVLFLWWFLVSLSRVFVVALVCGVWLARSLQSLQACTECKVVLSAGLHWVQGCIECRSALGAWLYWVQCCTGCVVVLGVGVHWVQSWGLVMGVCGGGYGCVDRVTVYCLTGWLVWLPPGWLSLLDSVTRIMAVGMVGKGPPRGVVV